MKKFFLQLSVFLFVLIVGCFIFRNSILKAAMEGVVSGLTGFKTRADELRYDFPSILLIRGLKIQNPKEFQEPVFADIPEIFISLDLGEFLQGKKIHLREMRLHIEEIHLEKNNAGESNIERLTTVGTKGAARGQGRGTETRKGKAAASPFQLDRLELTLRKVSYEDASGFLPSVPGGKILSAVIREKTPDKLAPKKVAVDLHVEKEIVTGIDSPQALVNFILLKVLYGTTFGKIMGIQPQELLQNSLASGSEFLKGASGSLGDFSSAASQILDKQAGTLAQSLGGGETAVTNAAGSARKQLGGMLGRLKASVESAGASDRTGPSS